MCQTAKPFNCPHCQQPLTSVGEIADLHAAFHALCELQSTINVTGGLLNMGDGNYAPKADPEWSDLAAAYLEACKATGDVTVTDDELATCQDCNRAWPVEKLNEVKHLLQRVAPGEPMPAGECPECGALCRLGK